MRTLENPVQNVDLLMGPISVLVGDRIEFDRECSGRPCINGCPSTRAAFKPRPKCPVLAAG